MIKILCLLLLFISCDPNSPSEKYDKKLEDHFEGLKEVVVTKTIVITKSGTYDFSGKWHHWKGAGKCNDQENQPQILRVEASDVVVKNFYFKGESGDPIHIATCGSGQGNNCYGSNKNVTLDGIVGHACEDLITIGTPNSENITIKNSVLYANPDKNFWDKTIQINFGKDINIIDNIFVGGARCIRFKPSTSGTIKGNKFYGCKNWIRATANDADISPMKNGPVRIKSDICDSKSVTFVGDAKCEKI